MTERHGMKWDIFGFPLGAVCVLGAAFLLGGILGGCMAGLMPQASAQALSDYLIQYLQLAQDGALIPSLWAMLWEQYRFLMGIGLLSLTALGAVGIPVLFVVRGFLLAFSVGGFCRVFGPAGLAPAWFLFGVPACLWAPALFLAGAGSLERTWDGLARLADPGRGRRRGPGKRALAGLLLCGAVLLVCVLLEYWALPALVGAAAGFVL